MVDFVYGVVLRRVYVCSYDLCIHAYIYIYIYVYTGMYLYRNTTKAIGESRRTHGVEIASEQK